MSASPTEDATRVTATREAVRLLTQVVAKHGPMMVFQSGGFREGDSPILVKDGALPIEPSDVQIATVSGVPVWVDGEQYLRAQEPEFVLDVAPGRAEGKALGQRHEHLITRAPG